METGAEGSQREDALLAAMREQRPDLDFHSLPEMWPVLPKGITFVYAPTLTGLPDRMAAAGWLK